MRETESRIILGWREWVGLPALAIGAIRAKLDTGARSSALHVDGAEEFIEQGAPWIRFAIDPVARRKRRKKWFSAPIVDKREVTDSSGHRSLRPFIRTPLLIADQRFDIEINLTNRREMLFPMLLGRTALVGRILVDPALSYVLGQPRKKLQEPA